MASEFVEVYEDKAEEWRWRRKSPNGDITATGAEGYETRDGARNAAERENAGLEIREV